MQQPEDHVTQPIPLVPAPAARPEALSLVYLDQVDELPQIRTESGMDDDSLDELGDSIIERGLLQPPLLRWHQGRLAVVAGHRRIAAMRRKGFTSFYAIVGDADENTAFEMQLAENIQREQLNLKEEAAAVRKLHDKHQDLGKVAQLVKKSKPWVSKRLSVSRSDFGNIAKIMLERGECEDLEILTGISQLEKLGHHSTIMNLRTNEDQLTRDLVREMVSKAKEEAKERKSSKKGKQPLLRPTLKFSPHQELAKIAGELGQDEGRTTPEIKSDYNAAQINDMNQAVEEAWKQGEELSNFPAGFTKNRSIVKAMLEYSEYDVADAAAFSMGLNGQELLFEALLDEMTHLVA